MHIQYNAQTKLRNGYTARRCWPGVPGIVILLSTTLAMMGCNLAGPLVNPTPAPLAAVTGLSLTTEANAIALAWTAVPNAESYAIYRVIQSTTDRTETSTGPDASSHTTQTIGTVRGTYYRDDGITTGTTYRYTVSAILGSREAPSGAAVEAEALSPTFGRVTALGVTRVSGGVELSWTSVRNAVSYNIYRGGRDTPIATRHTDTKYTDTTATVGGTYRYHVVALTALGPSGSNDIVEQPRSARVAIEISSDVAEPPTPRLMPLSAAPALEAHALDSSRAQLSWTVVGGATSYIIYRAINISGDPPGLTSPAALSASTSTSYVDSNLSNARTYYYQVVATNDLGQGPLGNVASVRLSATPPPPSVGMISLSLDSDSLRVILDWDAITGATSYNIYRAAGSGSLKRLEISPPHTAAGYTDGSLTSGETYRYQVTAVNAGGEGYPSDVQSITLPPGRVTGLSAAASNGAVTLSWSAVNGAASYRIYRALGPAGPSAPALTRLPTNPTTITTTGYIDRGLTNTQTYRYQVAAINADDEEGPRSDIQSITLPPDQARRLSAIAGDGQVTLRWGTVNGADSYRIYRALGPAGPGAPALTRLPTTPATITGTDYIDTSTTNGQTYRYQVVAVNAGGEGERSALDTATPQRSVTGRPGGFSARVAEDGMVTISWNAVGGADSYTLYRATTQGGLASASAIPVSSTSYTDRGLTNGLTYYYQVAAVTGGTTGMRSTIDSVTLPPDRVTRFSATAGNGQVRLQWSAVANADSYRIYRALGPAGSEAPALTRLTSVNQATSATISYIDRSPTNGQTYRYQVATVNAGGEGARSDIQSVALLLGQVTGLTLTRGDGQVTLRWSAVNGAASYRIYRATTQGSLASASAIPVSSTSYTDRGLTKGLTYYYQVAAVTGGTVGGRSDIQSVTLRPGQVMGLSAIGSDGEVALSWSAVDGADSYRIYRAGSGDSSLTHLTPTSPATITATAATATPARPTAKSTATRW